MLLAGVPEIKIKVTHRGFSGIAHGFDVLDDSGTDR
jgi:hypothetical protein